MNGTATKEDRRLDSVKAAAQRLDVSERWIWKALASGRMIRPKRLGRAVRFDLTELDRWIDAGCPALEAWERAKAAAGRGDGSGVTR